MILRRFMKHVTDQNWFAVGLDVIVVITGIFLGMQVTEWNEGRKDLEEEKRYLISLHRDLYASVTDQTGEIQGLKETLPPMAVVVQAIADGSLPSEKKKDFEQGLLGLGASARPITHFNTVMELQVGGKFLLIRNSEIRTMIIDLQQAWTYITDVMHNTQNLNANLVQELSRGLIFYSSSKNRSGVRYDLPTILQDKVKAEAISVQARNLRVLLSYLEGYNKQTQELLTLLEVEMKMLNVAIPTHDMEGA